MYETIEGFITSYQTFGGDLNTKSQELVICITGNPGIVSFYQDFAKNLGKKLNCPAWILGHIITDLNVETKLYNLQEQIDSKVAFLKHHLSKDCKIHIIGHSIGAYIVLELLKCKQIANQVASIHLLFPTIEYIASTPNGQFFVPMAKYFSWLLFFLAFIFTILPEFLQTFFIETFLKISGSDKNLKESFREMIKPYVLKNVFYLAMDEMEIVKERNDQVIRDNLTRIHCIFSTNDGWVPIDNYENLKKIYPAIKCKIVDYEHSFVFKHTNQVVDLVVDSIKN